MTTHGIIAKPTPGGWEGVYHHQDSYPAGLGVCLITGRRRYFDGDTGAMVAKLVDGEPVGWLSIVGTDLSLPPGYHDIFDVDRICGDCGQAFWRHYAQCYPKGGPTDPKINNEPRKGLILPDQIIQLGHAFVDQPPDPMPPQSFSAHGETPGPGANHVTSDHADSMDASWVYVLTEAGVLVHCTFDDADPVLVRWNAVAAMRKLDR